MCEKVVDYFNVAQPFGKKVMGTLILPKCKFGLDYVQTLFSGKWVTWCQLNYLFLLHMYETALNNIFYVELQVQYLILVITLDWKVGKWLEGFLDEWRDVP